MAILLVVSVPLVLGARWLSLRTGLVSTENDRTSHEGNIPVVGGWCLLVMGACLCVINPKWLHLYLPMSVLCILGIIDDKRNLSPRIKLIVELIVTFFVVFAEIGVVGEWSPSYLIWFGLEWFVMLAIINAMNLIDGIDGLAIGITFMILLLECVTKLILDYTDTVLVPLLMPLLLVLFVFNVLGKRRKVFLGDGGSLALGLIVCAAIYEIDFPVILPILPERINGLSSDIFWISAACLLFVPVPLIDMARVAIVRICHKESPFHADRRHFHHILIDRGLTHLQAALIEIGLNSMPMIIMLVLYACRVIEPLMIMYD